MHYIKESISGDEELIHVGHFHWFYDFQALSWLVAGVIGSIVILIMGFYITYSDYVPMGRWLEGLMGLNVIFKVAAFLSLLFGAYLFLHMMIIKMTTEICVTTKRIIYKRGLVARSVWEMNIDRIESVNVLQGVLGRIFGFGRIFVHGMGVSEVPLPRLAEPIKFRRAIDHARYKRKDKDAQL